MLLLYSGVASPKILGGQNVWFQANNTILFKKRLSKHKMTVFCKNLGGMAPLAPLATPMLLYDVHDNDRISSCWCLVSLFVPLQHPVDPRVPEMDGFMFFKFKSDTTILFQRFMFFKFKSDTTILFQNQIEKLTGLKSKSCLNPKQSRRHGGLSPPPNWNMKHYKSVELLSLFTVSSPKQKRKAPVIENILATVLIQNLITVVRLYVTQLIDSKTKKDSLEANSRKLMLYLGLVS